MADYDLPDDLLQLKVDFLAASAACERIANRIPSHVAVLAMEAEPEPELQAELEAERGRRLDIVMQIHRHDWWATVDNRQKADMALLAAAKEAFEARQES
ncbi:hypothetical protein E1286_44820 [Nonomuraea terrae]|uniref:Uncharacterized protein n=1 Tax=Nonomuraea terrae TaxID=2530383 RepID=A0A4V2YHL6_9ACTN|nr:hypothetical protein [Nonomuraea terrae]TDD31527.1 hypothetical protein E1286_44820 [Nonomuraea terrae]